MSTSYAVYRDLVAQAIRNDASIPPLVDYEIHTSGSTLIKDSWFTNTNRCCIVVTHQNRNSSGLGGRGYHGIAENDHLMRISVIQDPADDDTYVAEIESMIRELFKNSASVTMNAITYQINFGPPFKEFTVIENSRVSAILDIRAKYLD